MKNVFYLLLYCSICFETIAQQIERKPVDNIGRYPGNIILKLAPLSLIDFKQSIQVAIEYKVKPRTTFQNEIGYIDNFINNLFPYENFLNMRGLRTRFEMRFYQKNFLEEVNGFYLAPEIFFVHTRFQRTKELGRGCVDNWNCDYFELKRYTLHKNVLGYHFKIGYQNISFDRVLFDVYGGFGLRHVLINAQNTEIEQNNNSRSDVLPDFGPFDKGTFLRPSMSLGMKVGYLIR